MVSTLGTLKINEFALKGREADQINLALLLRKIESAQFRRTDVLQLDYNLAFTMLVRSICRPFRARRRGSVPRVETLYLFSASHAMPRRGKRTQLRVSYVFSVAHTARRAAFKVQESLAQGLYLYSAGHTARSPPRRGKKA
jgi:hypothetical protein